MGQRLAAFIALLSTTAFPVWALDQRRSTAQAVANEYLALHGEVSIDEFFHATGGGRLLEFASPRVRFWVAQAIEGAARRLHSPECRRVFSDFKDASGNLLEVNLIRFTAHPADYVLKFVWFADGSHESQCKGRIAAFTKPSSRVVFVCGMHFERKSLESELQIIHEILHSLGLGENPPSSGKITRQVAARCGGDVPRIR